MDTLNPKKQEKEHAISTIQQLKAKCWQPEDYKYKHAFHAATIHTMTHHQAF